MKSFIFITSPGGSSLSELQAQKSLFAYNTCPLESGFMEILDACELEKQEISNLGGWKEQEAGETQGTNSLSTRICQHAK